MKHVILTLLLTLLTSCGRSPDVNQPIVPPTVVGGSSKTVRYPLAVKSRYCNLTIMSNGVALPYNTYSYDCEYDDSSNMVKAFVVTYYVSLPTLAYLNYPLY